MMKYLLQKFSDNALINQEVMQQIATVFAKNHHSENTLYVIDNGVYHKINGIYILPNKCTLHTDNKFYEHISMYHQLVDWEVVIKGNSEC